jgi:hypothetical protein
MIREYDDPEGESAQDSPILTKNDIFEILSSERRRMILYFLEEHDDPVRLRQLATHIAAVEEEKDESDLGDDEIRRVYISLYQYHIPKMDDFGVISYDRDEGTVSLRELAELLFPYLHLDPMESISEKRGQGFLQSARSWFQRE